MPLSAFPFCRRPAAEKGVVVLFVLICYTVPIAGGGAAAGGALCAAKKASKEKFDKMKMIVTVNGQHFTATLAQNSAADALAQAMQQGAISLSLRDYAGFEKVGSLGRRFPAGDSRMTARPGDLMLYQGNQLVLFYGSNTWSYTRLGHIDDLTGWAEALGGGDVTVVLSLKN